MYFKEEQHFPQWLRQSFLIFSLFILGGIVYGFIQDRSPESKQEAVVGFLVSLLVLFIVNFIILSFKIISIADKEKFTVFVRPFQIRKKFYWEKLRNVDLVSYKKWNRFPGGWGIRYNLKGETFYTASGYEGIRLVTERNKKIIVGTNKSIQAKRIIEYWKTNYGNTKA